MTNEAAPAMTDEEIIEDYMDCILRAFQKKALRYFNGEGLTLGERFIRLNEIRNELKGIGKPDRFNIAAGEYGSCQPDEKCCGTVCVEAGCPCVDHVLSDLARRLGIADKIGVIGKS